MNLMHGSIVSGVTCEVVNLMHGSIVSGVTCEVSLNERSKRHSL